MTLNVTSTLCIDELLYSQREEAENIDLSWNKIFFLLEINF